MEVEVVEISQFCQVEKVRHVARGILVQKPDLDLSMGSVEDPGEAAILGEIDLWKNWQSAAPVVVLLVDLASGDLLIDERANGGDGGGGFSHDLSFLELNGSVDGDPGLFDGKWLSRSPSW